MIWAKLKPLFWQWRGVVFAVPSMTILVIGLRLTGLLQLLELAALDQFFLLRPPEPPDTRIVIVEINEADVRKQTQWPMSDAAMASVLDTIKQQQPRAIGLDIYRDLPVNPGHETLVKLFASTPNLIGVQKLSDTRDSSAVNAAPVLKENNQIGSNDLPLDGDGKIRRGLLYVNVNEEDVLESFALKLALLYLKPEKITEKPAASNPNYLQLNHGVFPIFEANDGGYVRADARSYQILLNYRGRIQQFTTVTLNQVQQKQIPADLMRGKVVLIGATAESLKDIFYTPYSSNLFTPPERMAGVTIHANLVSQILSAALDSRPQIQTLPETGEWLLILVWSIIGASLCWQQRSSKNQKIVLAVGIPLIGGVVIAGSLLAFVAGWWIPIVPSLLAFGGSAIAVTLYIAQSAGEMRKNLGRYLTDEVLANILETPSGLKLGGERRKVTLLFSDLRGFSAMSEQLSPEQVVQILNLYLGVMTDVINQYKGTINEFIGDGIFIMFGAPICRPDDSQRAIACAIAMQRAMQQVNAKTHQMNLPQLEMGIGINTGEVVAGNIGSQKRAQYTVIGSHVNLAARIETYTVGGQILISENTRQDANTDLQIAGQMQIEPKGIKEPITIYEISGIGGAYNLSLPEDNDLMVKLQSPVPVEYQVLQGKQAVGEVFRGELVSVSEKKALLHSPHTLEKLANLKLKLLHKPELATADIYAKVMKQSDADLFVIRFTNIPPQAIASLNSLHQ
ncbi:CHASE2 domain-containing protein [Anabaena sp. FACHB-709]|uniref:Adenylate cyclase n=3 Tax=Nostocaceae TaxID=1162 RepID=A0A1Z4KTD7_ANAVA|nr:MULTISPECIES: adenylate/guanylate cyclase domain-containing protein [Nostocaceae]BAY72092.1 adenylate cyclase [Trichormus variabilis NIES-23]HBW28787.1 adenylate/guanylate cyclase domain-containing protein [Nostoc sp. UBA8866]MBD2171470.1 adenylate/guanylate cyclase domain-containing protein [Anabaena cylindrica FACHB-318]MBD2263254.1 adenylate/guanylate cyclase domain-containing protein [Anabaena sp. FACHB-709]MBD2272799.1 adenylate/guanylate cyclase domain-containing protein [Nostoc sp. P